MMATTRGRSHLGRCGSALQHVARLQVGALGIKVVKVHPVNSQTEKPDPRRAVGWLPPKEHVGLAARCSPIQRLANR
jgi:hypothetical protein